MWERDRKGTQALRSITLSKQEQEDILDSEPYSWVNDKISFSCQEGRRQQWDSQYEISHLSSG